jgi:hypothetical protein
MVRTGGIPERGMSSPDRICFRSLRTSSYVGEWKEIEGLDLDARVELIRALIPLGLAEVGRMLDEEVERLAAPKNQRKRAGEGRRYRHGSNPGSVRLGGKRHPTRVPQVPKPE